MSELQTLATIASGCFASLSVPVGLEDVSKYPYLFAELIRRNYSDEEVKQVAGMNLISVFQQVERVCM